MIKISKSSILIIDDDELICETLFDIFQEKGFNVAVAKNGREGISEAEQTAFDIALIDIILPDMNGIDLLREFKKKYPEKIYIIITANATLQNAIRALKDGADDYYIKPLVIDEILRKAQDELEKKRFQRELIETVDGITELKKTVHKLKESEEKFRALFENTNDSILIHDRGSQFIEINQTACEKLGYSRDELLKLTPKDIISPEYKIDLQANIKALQEKGELIIESELITKDGNIFFVEINSRIFNFSGKNTIISVIRDITERKVAEQELKKSENNLKERVKELTCLYGLSRLFEKPGISLDEIFQGTLDLIPFAWQFPEITCTRIIFNEKEYKTTNFKESKWKLTSKVKVDGKLIEIEVLYLEENLFLKEEVSLLDEIVNRLKLIIEYKIIEEELIRKEKLATIGTLIGSIGHELRNPLGVINNSVYFLNQRIKDKDEKVSKHLNILQMEVNKASEFISDLLDFIRIRTPTFKQGNINKAIENVVDEIIIPKNIILERNLDVKLPKIHFDLSQMKQVFHNLILNAIQAMQEGGILEIKTLRRDDFVEISIKDSGIGISEENIDKIFEPLFTTKVIGIGLGLTIVKDILKKHNVTVEVMSNVGGGTIFTLKLPLKGGEL